MRRPLVCPTCTAVIGREVRHARRRLCSQAQAEQRRDERVCLAKKRAKRRATEMRPA